MKLHLEAVHVFWMILHIKVSHSLTQR